MKKIRSKKGLTLVELLVTVAVLGIVSGFSITIVVTAMNNYTEAAMMQKDQDTALMLEDYIVRHARVARKVEFIKADLAALPTDISKVSGVPDKGHQGFYVAKINNVIETFDYAAIDTVTQNYDYDSTNPEKNIRFTYEDVQKITIDFSRQKRFEDDIEFKCIYCMNYVITMKSGYTLRGQVIMNNADPDYLALLTGDEDGKGKTAGFVDPLATYKLIEMTEGTSGGYVFDPSYDTAIVFR